MSDVAACPFCGGTDVTVIEGSTCRWCVAQCTGCGATAGEVRKRQIGTSIHPEDVRLALAEWNTRAPVAGASSPSERELRNHAFAQQRARITGEQAWSWWVDNLRNPEVLSRMADHIDEARAKGLIPPAVSADTLPRLDDD